MKDLVNEIQFGTYSVCPEIKKKKMKKKGTKREESLSAAITTGAILKVRISNHKTSAGT